MNRYKLTYGDKSVVRKAETAQDAVEKLCDQYGWGFKLNMYDADTRGLEWAECLADTNGGINYDRIIVAEKLTGKKECSSHAD